jgi:hypothetical protein
VEPEIWNHSGLRPEKAVVKLDFMKKGESDEEIWECPQEFKQPAVVLAKWNDRGWSSDDGVRASARQLGGVLGSSKLRILQPQIRLYRFHRLQESQNGNV